MATGTFIDEYNALSARVEGLYDVVSAAGAEGVLPQVRNTYNLPSYISSIVALHPPVYDTLSGDLELGQVPLSVDLSYKSGAYYTTDQLIYIAPKNGIVTLVFVGNGISTGAIGIIKVSRGGTGAKMVVGQVAVKNDAHVCLQVPVREGDHIYFLGDNTEHSHISAGIRMNALSASFFVL